MKKLIAILAVFAFLGAALFAQEDAGTWSISGNGQINTRIQLKPLYDADLGAPFNYALVGASNYGDEGSFANGDVKGNLTLKYTRGIIASEISFNQRGAMGANFQANGENFQFRASRDLYALLTNSGGFGDLWGNYTFQVLEGITLEAAVSKDAGHWEQGFDTWTAKDRLGANYLLVNAKPMAGLEVGVKLPNLFQINTTWDTLTFPNDAARATFNTTYYAGLVTAAMTTAGWTSFGDTLTGTMGTYLDPYHANYNAEFAAARTRYLSLNTTYERKYNFMDDVLRRMVFGAKYNNGPLTIAFQFGLNGYGLSYSTSGVGGRNNKVADGALFDIDYNGNSNRIYFGAKYDIASGIDAGVYFRGDFGYQNYAIQNPESSDVGKLVDSTEIIFGGSFNYSAGPLGAGLTFRFTEPSTAATSDYAKWLQNQVFQVGLSARYDVLPDNLRVKMDFELQFPILGAELAKVYEKTAGRADQPRYTFTPQIIYNFLGTGAGDDPGVGMRIKYRVQGRFLQEGNQQTQNELTFAFKWSF